MDGVAIPGKLKLKKDSGVKKKKKSSTGGDLKQRVDVLSKAAAKEEREASPSSGKLVEKDIPDEDPAVGNPRLDRPQLRAPTKTKAELAFARKQAELQAKRIREKAQTSHRGRVEGFNQKMDSLTEFNDIPKVSWTK